MMGMDQRPVGPSIASVTRSGGSWAHFALNDSDLEPTPPARRVGIRYARPRPPRDARQLDGTRHCGEMPAAVTAWKLTDRRSRSSQPPRL